MPQKTYFSFRENCSNYPQILAKSQLLQPTSTHKLIAAYADGIPSNRTYQKLSATPPKKFRKSRFSRQVWKLG